MVAAERSSLIRTIPKVAGVIPVTTTSTPHADALLAYSGQTVYLRAKTAEVTVLLGSSTVVAGYGMVIPTDAYQEFYVDPTGSTFDLSVVSTAAAELLVLHD
jgi:hypothetical protein